MRPQPSPPELLAQIVAANAPVWMSFPRAETERRAGVLAYILQVAREPLPRFSPSKAKPSRVVVPHRSAR